MRPGMCALAGADFNPHIPHIRKSKQKGRQPLKPNLRVGASFSSHIPILQQKGLQPLKPNHPFEPATFFTSPITCSTVHSLPGYHLYSFPSGAITTVESECVMV
jgi:hypothetical protein